MGDRHRDRALQGGRRREPGAERDGAVDAHVEPGHLDARLAQRPRDPRHVARPPGDLAGTDALALPLVVGLRAAHPDQVVRARRHGGVRRVGERHGQAGARVVVGVLADQVHPAGRTTDDRGLGAVRVAEGRGGRGGQVGGGAGREEGHARTLGRVTASSGRTAREPPPRSAGRARRPSPPARPGRRWWGRGRRRAGCTTSLRWWSRATDIGRITMPGARRHRLDRLALGHRGPVELGGVGSPPGAVRAHQLLVDEVGQGDLVGRGDQVLVAGHHDRYLVVERDDVQAVAVDRQAYQRQVERRRRAATTSCSASVTGTSSSRSRG